MQNLTVRRLLVTLVAVSLLAITPPRAEAQNYIVNTAFTIPAQQYVSYPFELRRDAQIQGRFRATGGRNDVEVFILDADGMENFHNGHTVPTYYHSGRVTVATINVRLRRGGYYLVFNNRYSAFTNKAVSATVEAR